MIPDHVKKIRDEQIKSYPWLSLQETKAFETGFDSGFTHGKREGVKELIEYMKKTGNRFLECKDWERQSIGVQWKVRATAIEQHFAELLGSEGKVAE